MYKNGYKIVVYYSYIYGQISSLWLKEILGGIIVKKNLKSKM